MNYLYLTGLILIVSFQSFHANASMPKGINDTLRILAIGNSFSDDATEYLDEIAQGQNKKLIYGNLVIGGCALDKHVRNAQSNSPHYSYRKNITGKHSNSTGWTLQRALADEKWDYISIQQVSHWQGKYSSYYPYIKELISYIKSHAKPGFKFIFHQTWAYAPTATHGGFKYYNNNQKCMFDSICSAVKRVTRKERIKRIFFCGNAMQLARQSKIGEQVTRDGYHLNVLGRYIAACVWYETLFRESARRIRYKPDGISDELAHTAKAVAHKAIKKAK